MNFLITRKLTDNEVNSLLAWCDSVEEAIRKYGLKDKDDHAAA